MNEPTIEPHPSYKNNLEQIKELLEKNNREAYLKRLAKIGVVVRDKNDQ